MKAPIVALAATAAGFAAASAYLYGELSIERVQTQAEVAARSKHEAHTKQYRQALPVVATDGEASQQASILPFSQLQTARDSDTPKAVEFARFTKVEDSRGLDSREDRSPAPRLARRLMRERSTLPEPAAH